MKCFDILGRLFCAATSALLFFTQSLGAFAQNGSDDNDFYVSASSPPHIVFLGDSIASGYGLDGYSPDDKSQCASYANILSEIFDAALPPQANFFSDNLAVDGLTSKELLESINGGEYDDKLENADAVVISIGGNDLLKPLFSLMKDGQEFEDVLKKLVGLDSSLDNSLDAFEKTFPEIISQIKSRTKNEDAEIFVQTLYNPFEDYAVSALDSLADDKIQRLGEIIRKTSADGKDFTVCDIAAAFEGENKELTNIGSLDIHPNAEGHERIAEVLCDDIQSKEYTYLDYEAQAAYIAKEQDEKNRLEQRKNRIVIILAAASGAVIIVSGIWGIMSVKRKK